MFKWLRSLFGAWMLKRLIRDEWEMLAAGAWKGYQTEGRGCIMLALTSATQTGEAAGVYYLTSRTFKRHTGEPFAEVKPLVSEYDPENEIVLVCELPREWLSMRLRAEDYGLAPPEAYEVSGMYLQ